MFFKEEKEKKRKEKKRKEIKILNHAGFDQRSEGLYVCSDSVLPSDGSDLCYELWVEWVSEENTTTNDRIGMIGTINSQNRRWRWWR